MKKLYFFKSLAVVLFFQLLSLCVNAQNKNYVGINLTSEGAADASATAGVGLTIERQITKHSGIESGLFYRSNKQNYLFYTSGNAYYFVFSERYLSLPILYKFYSRIVNISAGTTFDYYLGYQQKAGEIKITDYSTEHKFEVGLLFKISKKFNITNRIIAEPELRVNPMVSYSRTYTGLGIGVKYKLNK